MVRKLVAADAFYNVQAVGICNQTETNGQIIGMESLFRMFSDSENQRIPGKSCKFRKNKWNDCQSDRQMFFVPHDPDSDGRDMDILNTSAVSAVKMVVRFCIGIKMI